MRKRQANTSVVRSLSSDEARARRAGATGVLAARVDSGFWSNNTIVTSNRLDVRYTMAVNAINEGDRRSDRRRSTTPHGPISTTPPDGRERVADCAYTSMPSKIVSEPRPSGLKTLVARTGFVEVDHMTRSWSVDISTPPEEGVS